jgi:rSAM/selenodomain-associated transferase 1
MESGGRRRAAALVLFGRLPEAGMTKTRLARTLGEAPTLLLYQAMLADTAWKLARIEAADPVAMMTCAGEPRWPPQDPLSRNPYASFRMFRQEGADFGTRLGFSLSRPLDFGYQKVVLVGADSPELSVADLVHALELLDRCDVVLGPAEDGGYYLIGEKRHHPELFQGITWSTNVVFEQTRAAAQCAKLSVGLVRMLGDIDTIEDLRKLSKRGEALSACPATAAWLGGKLPGQEEERPVLEGAGGKP